MSVLFTDVCSCHEDKLLLNSQLVIENTRRGKYLNKAQDINDSALMSEWKSREESGGGRSSERKRETQGVVVVGGG